ncbi:uncharacterized protein PRD47_001257, partial [Ara ararauna]
SFAPRPGSDDRFARQDRYGPPPEFPLASPCPGIVHHLSGPSTDAHAPPPRPGGTGETGRWCARGFSLATPRDPTSAGARRPSPSLRRGLSGRPLTRARARLLGPCFKTGRVGSRHRRGPRAPERGRARPGGAARSGRTERSPPRLTAAPGAGGPGPRSPAGRGPPPRQAGGGPAPPGRGRARRRSSPSAPGFGETCCPGALTPGRRSRGAGPPARRRPSQPTRSRSRRTAAEEMRPARAGRRPGGGPRAGPPPPARPRGRVARGTEGRRRRGSAGPGAAAVLSLGPGIRRDLLPGGSNTRPPLARRRATCPPEAFPADPEPVAAHRRGGNAPGQGRPTAGRRSPRRPAPPGPPPRAGGPGDGGEAEAGIRRTRAARPQTRRVESSGRTARAPPVYLLTVSRPLELSLQSSFQLSLTVLVGYRSRAGI